MRDEGTGRGWRMRGEGRSFIIINKYRYMFHKLVTASVNSIVFSAVPTVLLNSTYLI